MDNKKVVRFQTFYENLISFAKVAIINYVTPYNYPTTEIVTLEGGGFYTRITSVTQYGFDIEKMRTSTEYISCFNFLGKSDEIQKHRDSILGRNLSEKDLVLMIESKYLVPFIERIAEKSELQFDKSIFDEMYQRLESFLLRSEMKILEICPLPYFQSEVDEICLAEGSRIRRVSRGEKDNILKDLTPYVGLTCDIVSSLISSDFIIELIWNPVRGEPLVSANQVVLALSLFKPKSSVDNFGGVRFQFTWFKHFGGFHTIGGFRHNKPYHLDKNDVENFIDFWNYEYLPVVKEGSHFINIAISRFDDSRHRWNWVDGLIDLITSLEAMYLREKDELAYRLSHRSATLLGFEKTGEEKDLIRKFIKIAYDLRSDIVHGGKPNWDEIKQLDPNLKPVDFIAEITEYARKSILKFLVINRKKELAKKNYKALIDAIDSSIYNEMALRRFLGVC